MNIIDYTKSLDLERAGLHKRTPYAIHGVSNSQMSIARYYGRMKLQGESYTYFAEPDELVRDDVLAYIRKAGKAMEKVDKEIKRLEKAKWQSMQGDLV